MATKSPLRYSQIVENRDRQSCPGREGRRHGTEIWKCESVGERISAQRCSTPLGTCRRPEAVGKRGEGSVTRAKAGAESKHLEKSLSGRETRTTNAGGFEERARCRNPADDDVYRWWRGGIEKRWCPPREMSDRPSNLDDPDFLGVGLGVGIGARPSPSSCLFENTKHITWAMQLSMMQVWRSPARPHMLHSILTLSNIFFV